MRTPRMKARSIISSLPHTLKAIEREELRNAYCAECLRMITENTAKLAGGRYMNKTIFDVLDPVPEDHRTGDEVLNDIISRGGLELI